MCTITSEVNFICWQVAHPFKQFSNFQLSFVSIVEENMFTLIRFTYLKVFRLVSFVNLGYDKRVN